MTSRAWCRSREPIESEPRRSSKCKVNPFHSIAIAIQCNSIQFNRRNSQKDRSNRSHCSIHRWVCEWTGTAPSCGRRDNLRWPPESSSSAWTPSQPAHSTPSLSSRWWASPSRSSASPSTSPNANSSDWCGLVDARRVCPR